MKKEKSQQNIKFNRKISKKDKHFTDTKKMAYNKVKICS